MFRNFWVGSDGEFVFYSHIYFSFFDCEVKRFNFRFFNKGKVKGGGGGVWKVIHKLTLTINRPKKLSNKSNFF